MRVFAILSALAAAAAQSHTATRLRVEYIEKPLTIDVAIPRFSYALVHPTRGEGQTSYHLIVSTAAGAPVWDSGVVKASTTLNIGYSGPALSSDTDYSWSITWADSTGALSAPVTSTFSTALYTPAAWQGAEWVSSVNNGSLNTYRATLSLPAEPMRARLYVHGLGYAKTWINGAITDDHELGTFTTFQQRTLYDVVDVTQLLHAGCNAIGVMLGHGWFAQPRVHAGDRQFRLLLAVTAADGSVTHFASSNAGGSLVFSATQGPVLADDIYEGEEFDGRISAALEGFTTCGYTPSPSTTWVPTTAPAVTPSTFGSVISSHAAHSVIMTDRTYSVAAGGISQPVPGSFVFDFAQNMAGQTTLRVEDCPVGTVIALYHNEILNADGTVHQYLAPMIGNYTCAGTGGVEEYRTHFTYYGFRYVQIVGFPGVPGEEALTAHFIHSAVPQSGEFISSSPLLNAIQHATRFASWSNLMDIPTDCPQRERFGWLGDAQLSFETVIHNVDGGGFYTKWLSDFADTQVFDNETMNSQGALPDCIPFYGHGHVDSDPGWGIAAWTITDWFSDYYADDVFDVAWFPNMVWYMEHWVAVAQNTTDGIFPIFHWGDWANYVPGPYAFKTPEYPQFFYVRALEITAKFAKRLGKTAEEARYSALAASARALYQSTFFNATTNCYAGCSYVSQIFALALGLAGPQGSPTEVAVWNRAMDWWKPNCNASLDAHACVSEHFGGGIISLKYAMPLLDAHGETGLALKMHLQTDQAPGFGYWIETGGATTLWEAYDMDSINGGASRNHIMFGASGSWYYSTLAGLGRAPDSRAWQNLQISPPGDDATLAQLSYASASIDSSMGMVASSWSVPTRPAVGDVCGSAPEGAAPKPSILKLKCVGGTFTSVVFASYGDPTGSCLASANTPPAVNATCNAPTSVKVVQDLCIGKASCSIESNNQQFGGSDPCLDVRKNLIVALDGSCTEIIYSSAATVPVGAVATIAVPTRGHLAGAVVIESDVTVWAAGAFVPGAPGVTGAKVVGDAIVFSVGSGTYDFTLTAA